MQRRDAFTLVEMLVAMALTLFIMVIISSAFVTGLDTFRGLKGIGDLQAGLRSVSVRLRADLQANHFDGNKRLSDPGIWTPEGRPREGFFRLVLFRPIDEGDDADGIPSFRATQHVLHFTIKLRGARAEDLVTSFPQNVVPAGTTQPEDILGTSRRDVRHETSTTPAYNSQWAEVAYFLNKTGTTDFPTDPNGASGFAIHDLYRVQRALVSRDTSVEGIYPNLTLNNWAYLSCSPDTTTGKLKFHTPEEVARGSTNRGYQLTTNPTQTLGESLMLSNVVSFQVEPLVRLVSNAGSFSDDRDFLDFFHDNTKDAQYFDMTGKFELDTAIIPAEIPMPGTGVRYTVAALRITLRVWDTKTRQTRQITIIQDM
ncbi:MAG: type II secretion system protein J [Gemmataceae bacterium]